LRVAGLPGGPHEVAPPSSLSFAKGTNFKQPRLAQARREASELSRIDMSPRGDKSSYTGKQKRQARHIEEGYEERGVPEDEAERRAWATVNKQDHGGKKSGSGRGKPKDMSPSRKGGRLGGKAAASRPAAARSASAKKAAATRRRRA
jgi:hypothetical protein